VSGGRENGLQAQNDNRNPTAKQGQSAKKSYREKNQPENGGFSAACLAHVHIAVFCGTTKVVPCYKAPSEYCFSRAVKPRPFKAATCSGGP
jgi:hypothetical protein